MPRATRLFMCHDYGPNGRDIQWQTTVGDEMDHNIHVGRGTSEDRFVEMREARDRTLAMPRLIIPSLQVNIRGGNLPPQGRSWPHLPPCAGQRPLTFPIERTKR